MGEMVSSKGGREANKMICKTCGENKPKEAFEIRGRPEGEGICYSCTKLIRKERRKAYTREYYRKYRERHPEATAAAQKKSQEKLKARRHEAKLQRAIKDFMENRVSVVAKPTMDEEGERLKRLDAIRERLLETRHELLMEMADLKKQGDLTLLEEIERHDLRTQTLIRSVEEQMKGMR